jgi:hypothetical protein
MNYLIYKSMFGAIIIKSRDVQEAKEKWGSEMVDSLFKLLNGNHPDHIIKNLESEDKFEEAKCLMFILRNRK